MNSNVALNYGKDARHRTGAGSLITFHAPLYHTSDTCDTSDTCAEIK